jgi:hypothetical protein
MFMAAGLVPVLRPGGVAMLWLPAIALVATLVEAVAPHGWDNALLQIIPSWLAWLILSPGGAA